MLCRFSVLLVFFFKQKTAYEMRISDWSSDVCSSDLSWIMPAEYRVGIDSDRVEAGYGRITVFQDLPVRVRCHAGDGAELPGTDVQCVERWKLERTQFWIGFNRRLSRVTRKDSLTTADFRVDATRSEERRGGKGCGQ